jgi:hypothetical protein
MSIPGAPSSPSQIERRAIALLRSAGGEALQTKIAEIFRDDRNFALDRQASLVDQAAAEHTYAALLAEVGDTPECPSFFWSLCHPRTYANGTNVPGSRYGVDNPDNVYRLAGISDAYQYRIHGQRPARPPIDAGLTVLARQSGDGHLADSIGFLSLREIDVDADGHFEITLDASPADGRANHLSIASGRVLLVRDTHGDWLTETRHRLEITCIGASAGIARGDSGILAGAERYAVAMTREFLDTLQHTYIEHRQANSIKAPRSSGSYGGLVTQMGSLGWYQLTSDEALIVEVDTMGAPYFGFQLADMWMLAYDYTYRLSSMNSFEAVADRDGRYRFVIAGRDPGVHNWLDSGGHLVGSTTLRWQNVPPGRSPVKDTVTSRVVNLADLAAQLPSETRWLSQAERDQQRAGRSRGWRRRLEAPA